MKMSELKLSDMKLSDMKLSEIKLSVRPPGITYLALISLVWGIVYFVGAMGLLVGAFSLLGSTQTSSGLIVGAVLFALGLVSLGLGFGFWSLKRWAWGGAFVVYGVVIAVNVVTVLMAGVNVLTIVPLVAIPVLVMWYLTQPQIKAALGR
jgi:hypothetical protein